MRLLVTGGCGFIGSNFTRYILEHYDPEFVTNVDALTHPANLANVPGLAELYGDRYEFFQADIADTDLIEMLMVKHHFYAVVNFASESAAQGGEESYARTNVFGTGVLLEAARRHGVRRFLQVSTAAVYGPPGAEGRFTEQSLVQPATPYAASKAAADALALGFHKTYGEEVVVTRCVPNYGPWQFPDALVPRTVVDALRDRQVVVEADGQEMRDWVHVDDHCAALVVALLNGRPGEVYNIGSDAEVQDLDLVHRILDALGKPRTLIQATAGLEGRGQQSVDSTKIRTELGWKPLHRFEQGLRQTVEWYGANRAWWENLAP